MAGKTLYDKLWDSHVVEMGDDQFVDGVNVAQGVQQRKRIRTT